ncbi:hypothetical protein [Zestomonas carbonaria]|uniref:Uncharacterized protein n=1 Tax=Zestomonas carbonaria TaxID=2762745 RepID=A0A7U7EM58_9GAMM|nr:hypothetical protein [Pseudomonas carbonaria]CAD5107573.1 hypothetical protein PSEWESI4_01846 [Pseudomonas carbonaria]
MATDPAQVLRDAWPWLRAEYQKLDDNLRELTAALSDPTASGAERDNALIASAELLCRTIRACRQKDLFSAVGEDLAAQGVHVKALQREIQEHLENILKREEAVLVVAGLDHRAAQSLMQEVSQAPRHIWGIDPLHYTMLDRKVMLATEDICHRFPKTRLELRELEFRNLVKRVKAKYGIVGGLAIAAANTTITVLVPEPVSITKFSGLIGAAYISYSAGDD